MIERGEYVGAKNTSGGLILAQVLQELVPDYLTLLNQGVALSSMKTHRRVPELMRLPRLYDQYPDMVNNLMERMITVSPKPHESALSIARAESVKLSCLILYLTDGRV